ncbi:MAG: coiled coil domain-containing protein [Methylococcales bacterium]|nr:coiled coil domain-containing protein [Methylococcales bacterium]
MNTTEEYRQNLVELIDQSAKIDLLVVKSRQAEADLKMNYDRELEELRTKQRETTKKLHTLEESGSNAWENIGDGG